MIFDQGEVAQMELKPIEPSKMWVFHGLTRQKWGFLTPRKWLNLVVSEGSTNLRDMCQQGNLTKNRFFVIEGTLWLSHRKKMPLISKWAGQNWRPSQRMDWLAIFLIVNRRSFLAHFGRLFGWVSQHWKFSHSWGILGLCHLGLIFIYQWGFLG